MADFEGDRNKVVTGHPSRAALLQAFDRELKPAEQAAVVEHLRRCAQCESQWRRLQGLSEHLAAVASHEDVPEFPLRLAAPKETSRFGVSRLPVSRSLKLAALVAAALALAAGLWLVKRGSAKSEPPLLAGVAPVDTSASQSGGKPRALETPTAPERTHSIASHNRASSDRIRRHRNPALASVMSSEPTAAPKKAPEAGEAVFWALPYSNPALRAEAVYLIRVELPREAFLMAGVPASALPPAASREPLAAEVLLGSDGLPSAIRPAQYRPVSYQTSR